jgi:hypothetical protein
VFAERSVELREQPGEGRHRRSPATNRSDPSGARPRSIGRTGGTAREDPLGVRRARPLRVERDSIVGGSPVET